jgi:hypothetical protein
MINLLLFLIVGVFVASQMVYSALIIAGRHAGGARRLLLGERCDQPPLGSDAKKRLGAIRKQPALPVRSRRRPVNSI